MNIENVGTSFVLRGGNLVQPRVGVHQADIVVSEGTIEAITKPGGWSSGVDVIDISGMHVFPGVVDPHVHIGLGNGLEEYNSDSAAALFGGVTTGMYILIDPDSYLGSVPQNLDAASTRCHFDYAFHATLMTGKHMEEIPSLYSQYGIRSFKYYMSFRGDEGAYLGVAGTDDGAFYTILGAVASVGGILAVHPENIEVVWKLRETLQSEGRDDLGAWNESRPGFVEAEALRRAAYLGAEVGCPLYFVHVSSAEAINALLESRTDPNSAGIYAETCPHYLTHTSSDPIGALGKVNPPLRDEKDISRIWDAVFEGSIDTIGSDHVGRKRSTKQGSIWKASAGFPGMSTILPVLISEGYHRRILPLHRIAELTAYNPSQIFGLSGRKGDVRPGLDADLVVVDLDHEQEADPSALGTFSDYSLYEDTKLKGWPTYTFVRGRLAQQHGQLTQSPGTGRYLPR